MWDDMLAIEFGTLRGALFSSAVAAAGLSSLEAIERVLKERGGVYRAAMEKKKCLVLRKKIADNQLEVDENARAVCRWVTKAQQALPLQNGRIKRVLLDRIKYDRELEG